MVLATRSDRVNLMGPYMKSVRLWVLIQQKKETQDKYLCARITRALAGLFVPRSSLEGQQDFPSGTGVKVRTRGAPGQQAAQSAGVRPQRLLDRLVDSVPVMRGHEAHEVRTCAGTKCRVSARGELPLLLVLLLRT
ncbi:hypothetical protein EYF80_002850 [Liparis tanakae]|uniref:Uncharacterized protein n=1 Tax=Liparis tanakae TaxID=230148 RepID=A0A4Z2J9T2_9TELE|nr:hypothetical protein EYF80_002850 [Liparis tanakae]